MFKAWHVFFVSKKNIKFNKTTTVLYGLIIISKLLIYNHALKKKKDNTN